MSSSSRARSEAERWLKTLGLPNRLKGQVIDLREAAKTLNFPLDDQGTFRRMVLQAAARALKRQGAECIVPPEML